MGFLRKCARSLPKYLLVEVVGSDLSAAFKKIFDLRLEEVQFWGRMLIGLFLSFIGVFLVCDCSAWILFPFIWNRLGDALK